MAPPAPWRARPRSGDGPPSPGRLPRCDALDGRQLAQHRLRDVEHRNPHDHLAQRRHRRADRPPGSAPVHVRRARSPRPHTTDPRRGSRHRNVLGGARRTDHCGARCAVRAAPCDRSRRVRADSRRVERGRGVGARAADNGSAESAGVPPAPTVTVGLLHRDRSEALIKTLEALVSQRDQLLDVVVVDDASHGEPAASALKRAEEICAGMS